MAFLIGALYAIREQWRTGDRATAVAIALVPAWLFLSVAVLWVGGTIEVVLRIPGSSEAGTAIGLISVVLAGAILFGGPIWSLRRLSKARADNVQIGGVDLGNPDTVEVAGVNLGSPVNVHGCAMFLVFAATFAAWALVGSGLLALYDAVVGSSPDVFLLWFVLLFGLPLAATFLARGAIWRWIWRHSRSE